MLRELRQYREVILHCIRRLGLFILDVLLHLFDSGHLHHEFAMFQRVLYDLRARVDVAGDDLV